MVTPTLAAERAPTNPQVIADQLGLRQTPAQGVVTLLMRLLKIAVHLVAFTHGLVAFPAQLVTLSLQLLIRARLGLDRSLRQGLGFYGRLVR
jgi:hypothetical protein